MKQHNYQLSHNAAQIYEAQKVKAIFRPLAEATLKHVALHETDLVLDIACGTGIVSRCIAEQVPMAKPIVGIDLNEGMIEIAKASTIDRPHLFEWHRSDVVKLPFDDSSFTIAFCQQGLQFFPDKAKALQEIKRVLKPHGRLVVTVWSGISPLFEALAQALRDNISQEIAEQSLAPFAFRDKQVIENLISHAGFSRTTSKIITIERQIAPANSSLPREIAGNPVGAVVAEKGQVVMERIVKQVEIAIEDYKNATGYAIPQETFLFEAHV